MAQIRLKAYQRFSTLHRTMDIQQALAATTDVASSVKDLCTFKFDRAVDLRHLPAHLKREVESYERQMLYFLGQAAQLYNTTGTSIQQELQEWSANSYCYSPADLLETDELYNYYPAVVTDQSRYLSGGEPQVSSEASQAYLSTQLLSGAISKVDKRLLLHRAQKLVCSLDPLDKDFFPEELVDVCLQRERLSEDVRINRILGKKDHATVTKVGRRQALSIMWHERRSEAIRKFRIESGDWEGFETTAHMAFSEIVISEIVRKYDDVGREFMLAFWSALKWSEEQGVNVRGYYLDPRDEQTWESLTVFCEKMNNGLFEHMYYELYLDKLAAQRWMKEEGLKIFYPDADTEMHDLWKNCPDIPPSQSRDPLRYSAIILVGNSGLTDVEAAHVAFHIFMETIPREMSDAIMSVYFKRIREVFPI